MALKKPLYEWTNIFVTNQERAPDGSEGAERYFQVYADGTWREEEYVFADGSLEQTILTGRISKTELKILDAFVDRYNREPVPTSLFENTERATEFQTRYVNMTVPDANHRVYVRDSNSEQFMADDKGDVVEIFAINTYMSYLDRKYGGADYDIV